MADEVRDKTSARAPAPGWDAAPGRYPGVVSQAYQAKARCQRAPASDSARLSAAGIRSRALEAGPAPSAVQQHHLAHIPVNHAAEVGAAVARVDAPIVQRTKNAGGQKSTKSHNKASKSEGGMQVKPPRYSGHDSAANKRALLAVAKYRKQMLKLELSQPETVAVANQAHGKQNITPLMPLGTAICHKMAASWLADRVMQHCQNPTSQEFAKFAASCISAITPQATDQCPGAGSEYHAKACSDRQDAEDHAQTAAAKWHIPKERYGFAHEFARCVAQSPVNLFIGDSATNSAIGAEGDSNRYRNRAKSPRSRRSHQKAGKLNKTGKEMSSALPGE